MSRRGFVMHVPLSARPCGAGWCVYCVGRPYGGWWTGRGVSALRFSPLSSPLLSSPLLSSPLLSSPLLSSPLLSTLASSGQIWAALGGGSFPSQWRRRV